MTIRQLVLVTHRWLGILSSIGLSIVALTGAVIMWPMPKRLRGIVGALHQDFALGGVGRTGVIAVTAVAIILCAGGLFLWWKGKVFRVRTRAGWRNAFSDLHHVAGVLGLFLMLLLAVSGIGFVVASPQSSLKRLMLTLHTGRGAGYIVAVLYSLGSLAFVFQSLSGIVMWWKPKAPRMATGEAQMRTANYPKRS